MDPTGKINERFLGILCINASIGCLVAVEVFIDRKLGRFGISGLSGIIFRRRIKGGH